ncbi:MAG: hypothetical protein WBC53_06390 [Phycisphaerae bacterium]
MCDPNLLLTATELAVPRTPAELACWVEAKLRLIEDCPKAKEPALLHQGLFKKFYEEIFPLYRFVNHCYSGRSDIRCIPNLDDRDFDARILDDSISPPFERKVEITSAIKGHEQHLRMKYFLSQGQVSVWGTLSASGTEKRGHEIHVANDGFIAHGDLLKRTFSLIRSAVKRKSRKPNQPRKYGQGHILIVAFDDWQWFKTEQDIEALKDFVTQHILTFPLDFAALYVVGLSGNTFVPFQPPKIQDSLAAHQPPH